MSNFEQIYVYTAMALIGAVVFSACSAQPSISPVCQPAKGPALMAVPEASWVIQQTEVTENQFANFVQQTGYVTLAERDDPGRLGEKMGSAVFQDPTLTQPNWWRLDRLANWKRPRGVDQAEPEGMPKTRHPVVQISLEDAMAYAAWIGGRLPTLEEWRQAALGGENWELASPPADMANTWQGAFPLINDESDGYRRLAPAGSFPANAYGLHDMIGNAWEWTVSPAGAGRAWLAGGSFLCDVNFCNNGSPFGRQQQELDFSADHIGFRLVFDALPKECAI